VECIHFAAPPYTSEAVIDKLKDLIGVLNVYQPKIKINVVPFTKLQESIYKYVAEPYCITIMRRMMLRIATKVAKKCRALALATGESIGQVASQTLVSIQTINDVTNFPILRPLAVEDKVSIMNTARRIGTYEISIRPYEDCCTIFKPKKPKTKPKIEECEFFEKKWDWASQVDECVSSITSILMEDGIEKVEEGEAL
jgi:thiamine biosynthesis protein ThiI